MGSETVVNSSTANSATIALGTQHPNGLYHCLSAQSQREYFSLFLRNSSGKPVWHHPDTKLSRNTIGCDTYDNICTQLQVQAVYI